MPFDTGDMHATPEHFFYGRKQASRLIERDLVRATDKVLDFGAGLGRIALPLRRFGCSVVCVEQHAGRAAYMRSHRLKVYEQSSADVGEGDFDVVMCWFVLQHQRLTSAKRLVTQFSEVLKELGVFLFSYPTNNRGEYQRAYDSEQHGDFPERANEVSRWLPTEEIPTLLQGTAFRDLRATPQVALDSWVATKG